jgi:hypothetical protein
MFSDIAYESIVLISHRQTREMLDENKLQIVEQI